MTRANKRHDWSLASRLRLWFGLTSSLLVLAIGLLSMAFMRASAQAQIDALAAEELAEFCSQAERAEMDGAALEALARMYSEEHDGTPMQFSFWTPDGQRQLAVYGDAFEDTPPPARLPLNTPSRLGAGKRWLTTRAESDQIAAVLLDGHGILLGTRKYEASALLVILLAVAISLAVAELFCRRLSGMLERVAVGLRALRLGSAPGELGMDDPPLEIRGVTDAMLGMWSQVEEQFSRNQVLTAALAHELRAPIQNLLGEVEVALLREREGPEYRALLAEQREQLFELGDAVDNLVSLCRANTQEVQPEPERFDLADELRLRLARQERSAASAGVQLSFEGPETCPVSGDREDLCRALRNLVANAIQWSPPNSPVSIELTTDSRESLELTVTDAGPGIPAADRATIFEPFQRGRPRAGRRAGYGLGLTIVHNAVSAQGGTIAIEDPPGGGTRFRMRLPRRLGRAPASAPDSRSKTPASVG